jgi:hypothetical protein
MGKTSAREVGVRFPHLEMVIVNAPKLIYYNESVAYQMKHLTEFFVILVLIMGTKVESSLDASFTNRVLNGDGFMLS